MKAPKLYIVVPCYNEQEVLPLTAPLFREELERLAAAGKIDPDSRVLFVNDDNTRRDTRTIEQIRRKTDNTLDVSGLNQSFSDFALCIAAEQNTMGQNDSGFTGTLQRLENVHQPSIVAILLGRSFSVTVKSSVFLHICFGAFCFDFNQFFLGILRAAAGIDIFNKNFVFVHVGISLLNDMIHVYKAFGIFQIVAMPIKYHFSLINMANLSGKKIQLYPPELYSIRTQESSDFAFCPFSL